MAFLIEAPADARLIGDDEGKVVCVFDELNRFARALDLSQILWAEDISGILVENLVAIEKDGGFFHQAAEMVDVKMFPHATGVGVRIKPEPSDLLLPRVIYFASGCCRRRFFEGIYACT